MCPCAGPDGPAQGQGRAARERGRGLWAAAPSGSRAAPGQVRPRQQGAAGGARGFCRARAAAAGAAAGRLVRC